MKRLWLAQKRSLIFCFLFLALVVSLQAKSIVREGTAIVNLMDFQAPQKIKQGQLFTVYADFRLLRAIPEDASIFLHILDSRDEKRVMNADFEPEPAVSSWIPGEIVSLGPIAVYAPEELSAGKYKIAMGIITTESGPEGKIYVREPYTNSEIKDFVVGEIIFEEPAAEENEEDKQKKELIISDFKEAVDLKKWETRGATLELTDSKPPVGKVKFLPHIQFPAIILESFFRRTQKEFIDWSPYDYLELEVYQDPDQNGSTAFAWPLIIQVKDSAYKRTKIHIDKPPAKGTPIRVPLSKLSGAVDLTKVANFTIYVGGVNQEYPFYINYVKLTHSDEYKGKGAFVKFEGLELAKDKIYPGEDLTASFKFSITKKFFYDHSLFIHLFDLANRANTYINADVVPAVPTTDWPVGEVITEGPFNIHIPPWAPPGKYLISAGLFITYKPQPGVLYAKYYRMKDGTFRINQPTFPVDYFKQPYSNYQEYGDWTVGSFEVLAKGK